MSELSARARLASEAQPLPTMWIGFLLGIAFLVLELIEGVSSINAEAGLSTSCGVDCRLDLVVLALLRI